VGSGSGSTQLVDIAFADLFAFVSAPQRVDKGHASPEF